MSLPSKPGTGFQTLTLYNLGFDAYLITEHHICHVPTTRNSVPGRAWPGKDPISRNNWSNLIDESDKELNQIRWVLLILFFLEFLHSQTGNYFSPSPKNQTKNRIKSDGSRLCYFLYFLHNQTGNYFSPSPKNQTKN